MNGHAWVLQGDCVERMREFPDSCLDAVVTDPPYELGFMGKKWDASGVAFDPATWAAVLRVLKPGAHLLAFSGTRTYHRMVCAIEDAGFEIRDQLAWMYGSGFPKSLDVSKAIDKIRDDTDDVRVVCRWLRARMDATGHTSASVAAAFGFHSRMVDHWAARDTDSQPSLPTLEQWDQLRGLLAFGEDMDADVLRLNLRKGEPGEAWKDRPVTGRVVEWADRTNYAITSRDGLRRDEPMTDDAVRWSGWGTALKPAQEPIVLARKPLARGLTVAANVLAHGTGGINVDGCRIGTSKNVPASAGGSLSGFGERDGRAGKQDTDGGMDPNVGRWPANVLFDETAAAMLDAQANASRFFYVAKASRSEREAGLDHFPKHTAGELTGGREEGSAGLNNPRAGAGRTSAGRANNHPTVKPIALMRYLVRLITPPGGIVLDPFAGSGTTLCAAVLEGFRCVGIELTAEYVPIIEGRVAHALANPG